MGSNGKNKNNLTIGELSRLVGVEPYVLRFWEKEFSQYLNPKRTQGNQRRYGQDSIELVKEIKRLVKYEKFKLEGVKKVLEDKTFLNDIEKSFYKTVSKVSKKAQDKKILNDKDWILLLLKACVRDNVYIQGFEPDKCFYEKDLIPKNKLIARDIAAFRPAKILCINFGFLGDTVSTVAAVEKLKQRFPGSEISVVLWDCAAGVFKNKPYIKNEFILEKQVLAHNIVAERNLSKEVFLSLNEFVEKLKAEEFDTVVNLSHLPMAAILAAVINAPNVYGNVFDRKGDLWIVGNLWSFLMQSGYERFKFQCLHRVEHLLRTLGENQTANKKERKKAEQIYLPSIDYKINKNKKMIGFQLGARQNIKLWTEDKWIQLIRRIQKELDRQIILLGGKKEVILADKIVSQVEQKDLFNLVGRIDINELSEVISLCDLVITLDTGPKHIAADNCVPVVELSMGEGFLYYTGPYYQNCVVLRSKCYPCKGRNCKRQSCKNDITADAVFDAVLMQQKLSGINYFDVNDLRKESKDILRKKHFEDVNVYFTVKTESAENICYCPLKENSSPEKEAEKIMNYIYIKLVEEKNENLFSRKELDINVSSKDIRNMLSEVSFLSPSKVSVELDGIKEEIEKSFYLLNKINQAINSFFNKEFKDSEEFLNLLEKHLFPRLFEKETIKFIAQINWELEEKNWIKIFNKGYEFIGDEKEILLSFPKNVEKDLIRLNEYIKKIIDIIKDIYSDKSE